MLIHSACGGVGLAATYVAQMLGAEVYATVSSDAKVAHLMDNFHVPGNRIFQSRDKSFVSDIMRETNNRGIDVILNSLSGELLHVHIRHRGCIRMRYAECRSLPHQPAASP